MRIALDAMGGDDAPGINIEGAISALRKDPALEVVLVGEKPLLDPLVAASGYNGERLTIQHADDFVGMARSRWTPCAESRTARSPSAGS